MKVVGDAYPNVSAFLLSAVNGQTVHTSVNHVEKMQNDLGLLYI